MHPWKILPIAGCLGFSLAVTGLGQAPQVVTPAPQKVDQQVAVAVVPGQMKFDIESFTAKPNSTIRLTLTNKDVMQHNLVICRPGPDVGMKVAQTAWALGSQALAKQYIPDSPDVLFHTRLVDPNGADTFIFKAPEKEGDYPYVCTMPGHAMTMKGVMHITRSGVARKTPLLRAISYQLVPNAAGLEAAPAPGATVRPAPDGKFDLHPVEKQARPFAVFFQGTYTAVPAGGACTFNLGSTDAELSVDGRAILTARETNNEARLDLSPGPHVIGLRYRCNEDDPWCELSVRAATAFIPTWLMSPLPKKIVLNPKSVPLVERVVLPDCSPQSVAVGLPGGANYCFDPLQCAVRYGWTGRFLNVGPDFFNRGGQACEILGQRFDVGSGSCPLRLGGNDTPDVKFLGYRMASPPQMLFSVDGQTVVQTVFPAISPEMVHGFTYRFELPGVHDSVRFLAPAGSVNVGAGAGAFQNGVLRVPADHAARFDVSVFPSK